MSLLSFLSKKTLSFCAVLGILAVSCSSALAVALQYNTSGNFADTSSAPAGDFSGSFDYVGSGQFQNVNISTSSFGVFSTVTYIGSFTGTDTSVTLTNGSNSFFLSFASSLSSGGSVSILGTSFESQGFPNIRGVSPGTAQQVPLEADSIPLVLAGLGLGGGLLLKRKLQQKKVAESLAVIQSPELKSVQG
jgi:hypothetical protein